MNNHLKATLKKIKFDATTQVDEVELAWTAKNIHNFGSDSVKKVDLLNIESSTINIEEKLRSKADELEKNSELEPGDILKLKDKELKAQLESEAIRESKRKQNNAAANNQSLIQGAEFENNWNLPLNMIVFLENVTKSGENAKVLPWAYFKKIITEICNDRIRNRLEVENSLINTFIPFSEYVCLYFLKEYKLRRTAELKLLEFLVSLKYYVKLWPKAQIFASMCNIIGTSKAKDAQEAINVSEYDIYLQNFFLYAFERVFSDPTILIEHSEGTTWVPKQKVEDIVHSILVFETELNRKKFWVNLQTQYRVIGEGPDKDNEGLDADRMMMALVDHYVEIKRKNLKAITKFYYKNNQDSEKVLSIEDFASALAEVNDVEPSVANLVYPKDLTLARAFLYSLTSGNNSFAVTFKQFVTGLARFGMDCPFPFISLGGDEQRNKDYYNAGLSSDLFKKKNQQMKKRGAIQVDKKKFPGVKVYEPNKEVEEPVQTTAKPYDFTSSKGFKSHAEGKNLVGLKLDSASALFAQQFSVLRELNNYCKQFREVVEAGDQEFETMMKSFRQIAHILETGCEFLKFPINIY